MFKKLLNRENTWNSGTSATYQKPREVLRMCKKCYSFKYDNKWHFDRPEYLLDREADEEISLQLSQCPACVEEALAVYDMEYV